MSWCWESSRISGRLVMTSLWTSAGATDTSAISLAASSCHRKQQCYATRPTCILLYRLYCYVLRQLPNNEYNTLDEDWKNSPTFLIVIYELTLLSTTRSSHFSWLMMTLGTLRPPSPALRGSVTSAIHQQPTTTTQCFPFRKVWAKRQQTLT